jgi:hypothetical protein
LLGRVLEETYVGRYSAGGFGTSIDLPGGVRFERACGFLIQLESGKATWVEADREVAAEIQGKKVRLRPYAPLRL